jgi:hypothetical protein
MKRFLDTRFAPWSGLFIAAAAWAAHHQLGSSLSFADCRLGGPLLNGGLGLACAVVAGLGAGLSWRARDGAEGRAETRAFAAWLSVAGAGLFLLAILLQAIPGFIVPDCHR